MLLSVIIPAYNVEDVVADAMLSALAAARSCDLPYEVIVVDDGSADASPAVIGSICSTHGNATCIRIEHGGVSKARNSGLLAAKGRYVTFLDADDTLGSDGLRTLLESIHGGICSDMIIANMITGGCDEYDYDWHAWFAAGTAYSSRDLTHTAYYRHSACGIAYRRGAIAGMMFDTSLHNSEDAIWVNALFARDLSVQFIECDLYTRQVRPHSASRVYDTRRLANDWLAISRCSDRAASGHTQLERDVFGRLLYDMAHNMMLHAIRGGTPPGALLRLYPLGETLRRCRANSAVSLNRRLMRISPLLYACLLRMKLTLRQAFSSQARASSKNI